MITAVVLGCVGNMEIAIFGSIARGEDGADSDVDIAVEFHDIDLFELSGIKEEGVCGGF